MSKITVTNKLRAFQIHIPVNVSLFIFLCILSYNGLVYADSLINVSVDDGIYKFSDDIYDLIARFSTKGYIISLPMNIYPYSQGEISKLLNDISLQKEQGKIKLSTVEEAQLKNVISLFVNKKANSVEVKRAILESKGNEYHFIFGSGLSQETISRKGDEFSSVGTTVITSLQPYIFGEIQDSFAFSSNMKWEFHYVDTFPDLFVDETKISYKKLNMENVASIQSYGKFKLKWFDLELGKDNVQWGPGYRGQLVISDNPKPMDMMILTGRYGKIGAQVLTAKLGSNLGDKYMSAHRVELTPWKNINLGFSEVIVYGDRFAISYVNPFQIYLITESMIEKSDKAIDNVLVGLDFSYRFPGKCKIYSELVVDDAAPFETPFNHWDTKFGILAGTYITDPFSISDTDLRMEYTFINQYCYTHEVPINTYKHYSLPIGHWLGSDADDLLCEIEHRFTDKFGSAFSYELERHGEGGIDKFHRKNAPANDRWTFLSGVNQYKHSFSLGLSYAKIGYYSLSGKYTQSWLKNIDNIKGKDGTGSQFAIEGHYRF